MRRARQRRCQGRRWRKDTVTFRQLEVEHRKDDGRLFDEVVGALRRAGARRDRAQKLAKALDVTTKPRPASATHSVTPGRLEADAGRDD